LPHRLKQERKSRRKPANNGDEYPLNAQHTKKELRSPKNY